MAKIRAGEIFYDIGIDKKTLDAAMRALKALAQVGNATRQAFAHGNPVLTAYNRELRMIADAMKESKAQFELGQITAAQYADKLRDARLAAEAFQQEIEGLTFPDIQTEQDFASQLALTAQAAKLAADNMKGLLDVDYKSVDDELAAITTAMDKLGSELKDGKIDSEQFENGMRALQARSEALDQSMIANVNTLQRVGASHEEAAAAQTRFAETQSRVTAAIARSTSAAGAAAGTTGTVTRTYDRLSVTLREQGQVFQGLLARIRAIDSEMKNNRGNTRENIEELRKLKIQLDASTEAYRQQIFGVKGSSAALNLNAQDTKLVNAALMASTRANDAAEASIRRHTGALQSQNLANILTQGSMTLLTDRIFQASPTLGIFTNSLIYSTQGLKAFLAAAMPIIAVAGSIIGAVTTLAVSLRSAVGLEGALANVRKTTGLTTDELKELTTTFQGVSKEIPISTLELVEMARVAGQLGIQGRENLERFSVAVAKLSIATDVVGEEGATALARFLQAAGTEADRLGIEAERLGNVMNALENSTAATAREILDMTSYTAGLVSQVGASTDQVLAMNAALLSLGVQQEAGGSAIVRILAKLQSAASEGTDRLRKLAEVTGLTAGEFEVLILRSPAEALEVLARGLNEAANEGDALSTVLTELGINEVRERRTLSALAQGVEVYSATLKTARREMFIMNSLEEEIDIQRGKTTAKLQLLRARFSELTQNIGNELLPALHKLLDALLVLADNLDVVIIGVGSFALALGAKGLVSVLKMALGAVTAFSRGLLALVASNAPLLIIAGLVTATSAAIAVLNRQAQVTYPTMDRFNDALRDTASIASQVRGATDLGYLIEGLGNRMLSESLFPPEWQGVIASSKDTFVNAARRISLELNAIAEPTAADIANATTRVLETWGATTTGAVIAAGVPMNREIANAIEDITVELQSSIQEAVMLGLITQPQADAALAELNAALDTNAHDVLTIANTISDILLDARNQMNNVAVGAPSSGVSAELLQAMVVYVQAFTRQGGIGNAERAVAQAKDNVSAYRLGLQAFRNELATLIEETNAGIITALTGQRPKGVGEAEYTAIINDNKTKIVEIVNAFETYITDVERAVSQLDTAKARVQAYTNTLIQLNALLAMPRLDPAVREQILASQAEYRNLITILQDEINSLENARTPADRLKEETSKLDAAIQAYNDGLNSLLASQDKAYEFGEELLDSTELAVAQAELLNDLLQVFFEVDPSFRFSREGAFARYSIMFEMQSEVYRDLAALIPDFAREAVRRLNAANRQAHAEFNRLLPITGDDQIQVNLDKANRDVDLMRTIAQNQLNLIRDLDNEILRLSARTVAPEDRARVDEEIDNLLLFRKVQWETYQTMVEGADDYANAAQRTADEQRRLNDLYVDQAAAAAVAAGARDFSTALRAARDAGFALRADVIERFKQDFPEVADEVREAEDAITAFYAAFSDINLRQEIGLITELEALQQKLRAAEVRLLAVAKAFGTNSIQYELAAAQVARYRNELGTPVPTTAFDEYAKAVRIIERNLSFGLIPAEEALREKIKERQTLISALSREENVNVRELQRQLQLLAAEQANLNELVARSGFADSARAYAASLKEIEGAVGTGLIGRQEELNLRINAQNELIKAAIARYGEFSSIVAFFRGKLRDLTIEFEKTKAFDDYNSAVALVERNLRAGLIPAEVALQERIREREQLINSLRSAEEVNAQEILAEIQLMKEEQEALNELISKNDFYAASKVYSDGLRELNDALSEGFLTREEELNRRIELQNGLIDAAIQLYGRYSPAVRFLQAQLKALTTEYDTLTGSVRNYNVAIENVGKAQELSARFVQLGIESELEGAQRVLSAKEAALATAKDLEGIDDDRLQILRNEVTQQQEIVDLLERQKEIIESIKSTQEGYALTVEQTNALVSAGVMTASEAAEEQARALELIAEAMKAEGITDEVITLIREVIRLREEARKLKEADDLVKAAEAYEAALAAIAKDLSEGDISIEESIRKRIDLMRSRANALEAAAGEVTDAVKELRAAANELEALLAVPATTAARLAAALSATADAVGEYASKFVRAGSTIASAVDGIIAGLKAMKSAQNDVEKSKAFSSVAEGIAAASNAFASLIPRANSAVADILDGFVAIAAAVAEMVLKEIPGIGALIGAVGGLVIRLLGDMSSGIQQVKADLDNLAASSKYLSRDMIGAFSGISAKINGEFRKSVERVSRGGLLGLLGFKKSQVNKEVMDFIMGIANGLANGFANAMTQAVQSGVAGGDWREAFRDAFKNTVLNTLIETFVTGALLAENFQDFIQRLTIAIATGNMEEARRLINEELPQIIADGERQVDEFIGSVPDSLKTYGKSIASGAKNAFQEALKGAFLGEKDWKMKFRNAFKDAILNALIEALIASAAVAVKIQEFIQRLTEAIANGNLELARSMIRNELPGILREGEEMIDDLLDEVPEELRPESDPAINATLSSGLNNVFSKAVSGAFAGEPDWAKELEDGVRNTLITAITNALVEAMMMSEEIEAFMIEFTRILNEEGPEAAAKYARDNFDAVVAAGTEGARKAGAILSDIFGKEAEDATEKFVEATMLANDFMTESLARTIAFLSTINDVIDEATSDMMISIAQNISRGFEDGFRRGIRAMLDGEEDWRDTLGDSIRDTILSSLIDSFVASAAIGTLAADFTEGFLRAMQDPQVDAAQWARDNIDSTIAGMSALIETFVNAIPPELLPSSNPRSSRYVRPERNEPETTRDRNPRAAGTNISEITGPTRDLLIDLLRPLSIIPSWTSMIRDIRNDVRAMVTNGIMMPGSLPNLAGEQMLVNGGVTNIKIEKLTVVTQSRNAREFYRELSQIAYRENRGGV
jgi:TP901 family phage tail tape measure protein